jgi:hypothetical protein
MGQALSQALQQMQVGAFRLMPNILKRLKIPKTAP